MFVTKHTNTGKLYEKKPVSIITKAKLPQLASCPSCSWPQWPSLTFCDFLKGPSSPDPRPRASYYWAKMYGTGGSLVKFICCAKIGETHRALTAVDDRFLKSAIILDDFRTTYLTQKLVRDVCCVAVFRNFAGFPHVPQAPWKWNMYYNLSIGKVITPLKYYVLKSTMYVNSNEKGHMYQRLQGKPQLCNNVYVSNFLLS